MENNETEESNPMLNNSDTKCPDSTENFKKKFIYDLFEKNGILNDLRAYLRGHIVKVLKCANTGETTPCQKYFTQRLEHTSQAINILIAEYLLRLEFNYTLSVFISEMPLANMIFDFTKTLLKSTESTDLSFSENDVWSILNYLGIKCDSEHACRIIETYKTDQLPLLLCVMKCIPLYTEAIFGDNDTSEENLSSNKSTDTLDEKYKRHSERRLRKCKHYAFCKTCQNRILRLKEKYSRRKYRFVQNPKKPSVNSLDIGLFMKNLSLVEQGIINEMFEQLKSVYESEVEMVKAEQETKIKKSVANHALQLQKHREELEESFKDREVELNKNIDEKKKFLWNLAKSLRQQHEHMSRAMADVKSETERLTAKENHLKNQIQDAEEILRKRGEDMRQQISDELKILEQHLETMKKERDSINIERMQLEHLKANKSDYESGNVKREYDLVKTELQVLRQFVESANIGANFGKCMVDKGTVTDSLVNNLINNEDRGMNKLYNDLKQKNVNFNMSNEGMFRDYQRASQSSLSSDDRGHIDRDVCCDRTCTSYNEVQTLRNENQRLNVLTRQQSDHIASLARERTRLQSELTFVRPQTAPTLLQPFTVSRLNQNTNNAIVNGIGGGEQLNMFPETRPRVLIPTDNLPFIGVLRDRHTDSRRHLINQWRSLRRRVAPQVATTSRVIARDMTARRDEEPCEIGSHPLSAQQENMHIENNLQTCSCEPPPRQPVSIRDVNKQREKSPKSMLREAKEKLRNNSITKEAPVSREKSPNTTLREAKLRLRKLEIEAEAVERSYQDFRRRQRKEKLTQELVMDAIDDRNKDLGIKKGKSLDKLDDPYNIEENKLNLQGNKNLVERDFDKYLKAYQTKFQIPPFKNKNAMSEIIKPIPVGFSQVEDKSLNRLNVNYLETPLTEFRKLYHTKKTSNKTMKINSSMNIVDEDITSERQEAEDKTFNINKKKAELEILKDNINKIYNLSPNMTTPVITPKSERLSIESEENKIDHKVNNDTDKKTEDNVLRVEIENICETNNIKMDFEKDVLVVVESSINTKEISDSEIEDKDRISTQMTILVSPKEKSEAGKSSKSPTLEKLTDNDLLDAIFHAKANKDVSSIDMQLELSKMESSIDKRGPDEYLDDFSADVDNYNSRSDYEHSPISLAKDSEENFWDS